MSAPIHIHIDSTTDMHSVYLQVRRHMRANNPIVLHINTPGNPNTTLDQLSEKLCDHGIGLLSETMKFELRSFEQEPMKRQPADPVVQRHASLSPLTQGPQFRSGKGKFQAPWKRK